MSPTYGDEPFNVWVGNVPDDASGDELLRTIRDRYGAPHVSVGVAVPPSDGERGVYIREDVLEPASNYLKTYLSGP